MPANPSVFQCGALLAAPTAGTARVGGADARMGLSGAVHALGAFDQLHAVGRRANSHIVIVKRSRRFFFVLPRNLDEVK